MDRVDFLGRVLAPVRGRKPGCVLAVETARLNGRSVIGMIEPAVVGGTELESDATGARYQSRRERRLPGVNALATNDEHAHVISHPLMVGSPVY